MFVSKLFLLGLDLVIFYITCTRFFKRKKDYDKLKVFSVVLLFLMNICAVLFINNLLLKYLFLTITICLMMYLLFDEGLLKIGLVVILVYGLFFMTDYSIVALIEIDMNLQDFMKYPKNIFVAYGISRTIDILIIATFSYKTNRIILESRYIYKFILMSFLTISGLIVLIIPDECSFISNKYLSFILIINNLFVYYILNDFIKVSDHLRMKSISEERAKNELKLWQKLKEKEVIQRKIMHDYSNTLICIKGLLEQSNYHAVKKYVENISVEYQLSKSFIATGNPLVDVLINTKYEKALEEDITMILKLDNLAEIKIRDEDFIVLISNLLDNAIEYTTKLPKNKREIFFSIQNMDKIEIMIRNPIECEVVIEDNLIKSTKNDENHGFGLLNIKEVIERYEADHYIDVDEGYFTHYIEI